MFLNDMDALTPKFDLEELYDVLPSRFSNINSSELYAVIKSVTEVVVPEESKYGDLHWDFYLPVKEGEKTALVPVEITQVNVNPSKIIFRVNNSELQIYQDGQAISGEKAPESLNSLLEEIAHFVPHLQQDPSLIEKLTPYSMRTGKILGKYVLPKVMSRSVKNNLLSQYQEHLAKELTVTAISLDDYFETAAIAYRAIFGKETQGLTPRAMYERWAEGRHGGLLDIVDSSDKDQFGKWFNGNEWRGSHPFELLYSPHNVGITLYPPSEEAHYSLAVGVTHFYPKFLDIASAFMKQEVPFQASSYENVLHHLAGETIFRVNGVGLEENLYYFDSEQEREKYFPHIIWTPLKIPQWK